MQVHDTLQIAASLGLNDERSEATLWRQRHTYFVLVPKIIEWVSGRVGDKTSNLFRKDQGQK